MDGRGRCLDNVFIERLWRSLKYEAVYLHELVRRVRGRAGDLGMDDVLPATYVRTRLLGDAPRPKPTARSEQHEHPNAAAWSRSRRASSACERASSAARSVRGSDPQDDRCSHLHPRGALWKCRAYGRPADVALNLKVGEAGAHRPLEISRPIAAAHACAAGREIPTLPQRIVILAMIKREHEGVTSQPGYTLSKPSNCPNNRDHFRRDTGTFTCLHVSMEFFSSIHVYGVYGSKRNRVGKDSDRYKVINLIGVTVCNSIPRETHRGPARVRPSVPWSP